MKSRVKIDPDTTDAESNEVLGVSARMNGKRSLLGGRTAKTGIPFCRLPARFPWGIYLGIGKTTSDRVVRAAAISDHK